MKTTWKTTCLLALPLAGLLIAAPAAEARRHHYHKRHDHCESYKRHGWHDRGRHNDYYRRGRYNDHYDARRGWYGGRGSYYGNDRSYPSRYPYGTYYGGPYNQPYYGELPRW